MDEGFEDQLDIYDNSDSVECSIPPDQWPRYLQERAARQIEYFAKKNDFIFNVRLAFFHMHAFDLGAITYENLQSILTTKVEQMRKYENDFPYPFVAFDFIVKALFSGEEWDEPTVALFNDMYLMVFPELAHQVAAAQH